MHRLPRLPHRPARTLRTLRALRPGLALAAMLGVTLLFAQSGGAAPNAHTASTGPLPYQQGYYVTNWSGCYGSQTSVYHCTAQSHRDTSGTPVSDYATSVPNGLHGLNVPAHPVAYVSRSTQAAASSSSGSVPDLIRSVFGANASGALAVARCESGYNASAYNGSSGASGVFQFLASTWATTSYAGYSRYNAWANVNAAHQVFVRDGYSWREWSCRP